MSKRSASSVSIDEIARSYFGASGNSKLSRAAIVPAQVPNELTASAKFIANETRKKIGSAKAVDAHQRSDEQQMLELVRHVEEAEGEELSYRERNAVLAALSASLEHYGVLSPLIENHEVNDVIVRSYKDISIQIGRRNIQTDIVFPDHDSYKAFVESLLKRVGKACTLATPVIDVALDKHVRACVTHESFSPPEHGPMLTLRIARFHDIGLEGLMVSELAPSEILDYLSAVVRRGVGSVLIGGEVGTGKTTLVRALASRIAAEEAILVIEDTHEIQLNRPFVRTLLTREANSEGAGRITPAQAIRAGMRMAMNRVILGEMRDGEAAEAFVDVCASGHAGMSTIHAKSARDALSRLELFLARAQGSVTMETIRRQVANAIAVVVFLGMDSAEQRRRIISVMEVGSASDGSIQMSPIFSYRKQQGRPQWLRDSGISQYLDVLNEEGVELSMPGSPISLVPETVYSNLFG